jgi:hypothetical protein
MTDEEFNRIMPQEFWREVVDRVAAEVPGTLLLAEAFWLMEGYFVRTLGMHRVYNSAFMNMMRDEENAKYRSVIKNTLEFDPDIMKRYVNFMSNPDERTAIDQFGTGDKCFGVAVLMSTLPGLPMFGHGQVEGFTEKYGMEYQRPRYDETPNPWLVERHEREIAPLLKKRWLFAESSNFLLYDFFEPSGSVDENVFAYSNRNGDERAVVIYNNRFGTAHGTIDFSAAYADKSTSQLRQRRLREGLDLTADPGVILAWRDSLSGLQYLRRANVLAERGLTFDLHAYQSHVFLGWRELRATAEQPWDRLCDQLNGRGVSNLDDALVLMELKPVHDALHAVLDPEVVRQLADLAEHPPVAVAGDRKSIRERNEFIESAWTRCEAFFAAAQEGYRSRASKQGRQDAEIASTELLGPGFRVCIRATMRIPTVEAFFPSPWPASARRVLPSSSPEHAATALWGPVFGWCVIDCLSSSIDANHPKRAALELFDRLRLREPMAHAFGALGMQGEEAWRAAGRIKALLVVRAEAEEAKSVLLTPPARTLPPAGAQETFVSRNTANKVAASPEKQPKSTVQEKKSAFAPTLWHDPDVRWLTGTHHADGHDYLVREPFEELLWWIQLPALLKLAGDSAPNKDAASAISTSVKEALAEVAAARYRVDQLLIPSRLSPEVSEGKPTAVGSDSSQVSRDQQKPTAKPKESVLEPAEPKHS